MTTDALIRQLAAQARPVRPLRPPGVRFVGWVLFAAAWVTAGIAAVGARIDVGAALRDPTFVPSVALPAALGVAATMSAFVASVPGRGRRWPALIAGALLAAWLSLVVIEIATTGGGSLGAGVRCMRNLAAFGAPPGLLAYFMLRRAAPLARGATGLFAALGAAALAHAGTCFVCRNHGALHILVWHLAFVLLLAGAGVLVGRTFFK